MNDVLLRLEPGDEVRRLTLASALRDERLAKLERAIALERAKRAALLKAAQEALRIHAHVNEHVAMQGNALYISNVLRAAIAEAEKETQ